MVGGTGKATQGPYPLPSFYWYKGPFKDCISGAQPGEDSPGNAQRHRKSVHLHFRPAPPLPHLVTRLASPVPERQGV